MTRKTITSLLGVAGVAKDENQRARYWGKAFEVPMILIALWIIAEWYLGTQGAYPKHWEFVTNWVVWIFFALETALLTALVRDKRRYLASNWINLVIIVMGVPLLWHYQPYAGALRTLRLLLLFGILLEVSSTARLMLSRNNIGLTLFVVLIVIVMAGTSMAAIDPAIETFWDGIWWAWVTVTTVGYGDLVPESPQGKVFGGLLMVLGLGLFSLITASFSAFLINREEEEFVEKETELTKRQEQIADAEKGTVKRLERIELRLEKLEGNLVKLIDRLSDSDRERKREED